MTKTNASNRRALRASTERCALLLLEAGVLATPAMEQDALVELKEGRIPKLKALCLFNGTVYPWNRPCYGITGGKPHLRIESRFLPAGPSIVDEVANAALWVGLMIGLTTFLVTGPIGADESGVASATAAFTVTTLALRPYAGRLSDRRGRRPLLIGGGALFAIVLLGHLFATAPFGA